MGSLRTLQEQKRLLRGYPSAIFNLPKGGLFEEFDLNDWEELLIPTDLSPYFIWHKMISEYLFSHYIYNFEGRLRAIMSVRRRIYESGI